MPEPRILHINITDFMAAVEEREDAALRSRPFVVGWAAKNRSVVLAVSGAAYREGLRRGMALDAAQRKIRGLLVLPPDFDLYRRADERSAEIARRFSPRVEARSGGHLYLDLAGTRLLFGPPEDCAARVRRELIEGTGLLPAVGLSSVKVVSKVGTRVARPWGFVTVLPGEERSFLAARDVRILPGVGPKLFGRMSLLRILTIGALADLTDQEAPVLGAQGSVLRDRARGIDPGEVRAEDAADRILSRTHSFPEDENDPAVLRAHVGSMVRDLGFELRRSSLAACMIGVTAAYTDGVRSALSRRSPHPSALDAEILPAALDLLAGAASRRVRIRSIRCELSGLAEDKRQLDLFLPPEDSQGKSFQIALDRIRLRYGESGIVPCAFLAAGGA